MAAVTGGKKFAKIFMFKKVSWVMLPKKKKWCQRAQHPTYLCLIPSIFNSINKPGIHLPIHLSTKVFGAINILLFTLEMPAHKLEVLHAVYLHPILTKIGTFQQTLVTLFISDFMIIPTAFFQFHIGIDMTKLTLILRRSRTGTVWFYTSTSNKRAARPKLYTKSLTRDLKLMYSRLTMVRISINLQASCVLYIGTGVSLISRERFLYI